MSLGGSYPTLNVRKYTDALLHELQQKDSRLSPIVDFEKMETERTYFNKTGKAGSRIRTSRLEDIAVNDRTYERRFASPTAISSTEIPFDDLDADRWLRNPQPEVIQSMFMEMNRQKDALIHSALAGMAARELDGVHSSVPLDATMQVDVNDNMYTDLQGDTGLHEGKILRAKELMYGKEALDPHEIPFVIGSAKVLTGLQSRSFNAASGGAAGFFQGLPKINSAGLYAALDGFAECRYISYEHLGVDSSNDNIAYMVAPGAIKLGEWRALEVKINDRPDKEGIPLQIHAKMSLGAVRMYEEKVVKILCDPTNAYPTS